MDNYHVSPTAGGWELKKAGAERASKRSSTKQELVASLSEFFQGKTASVKSTRPTAPSRRSAPTPLR